jgi:hypothetical protein
MVYQESLKLLVRCRGPATWTANLPGLMASPQTVHLDEPTWTWVSIPLLPFDTYEPIPLEINVLSGSLDVDFVIPAAGPSPWLDLAPGESVRISGPSLFHNGYTDRENNVLVFPEQAVARSVSVYGPRLPLEPGVYDVEFVYETDRTPGTPLGTLHRRFPGPEPGPISVMTGEPAVFRLIQEHSVRAAVDMNAWLDETLIVREMIIRRVE